MGGKSGAEGGEPDLTGVGVVDDGFLERGEDARAADVSVLAQDGASFVERVRGESVLDGEDDIAPAGVGNEAVRRGGFFLKELKHGPGGEFGDFAVELVFEAALGIHETDFFTVLGLVEGLKSMESKLAADRFWRQRAAAAPSPKRQRLMRTPGSSFK